MDQNGRKQDAPADGKRKITMWRYIEMAKKAFKWISQLRQQWINETNVFFDQFGEPYANVRDIDGHEVTLPVRKESFANAVIRRVQQIPNVQIKQADIKDFVREVVAMAEKQPRRTIELRIAGDQNRIVYNIGNDQGDAVEIIPGNWAVKQGLPELFKKYQFGGQQVLPVKPGVLLQELFRFINIHDLLEQILFMVYIVSLFIPPMVHPVLILYGGQGTAKSTASRFIKLLVDPSIIEMNSLSGSLADIAQFISHNYLCVFDNLDKITSRQSDLLCQAVTGGNITKRALYTNEGDVVLPFKGCLILNGINIIGQKSDLGDRSLTTELQRIDEFLRKDEIKLMEEFLALRPKILASIFDILSKAMNIYPTLEDVGWAPRLAGFYKWGIAISLAMGGEGTRDQFIEAFKKNRAQMHRGAIAGNSFAEAVIYFMQDIYQGVWEGRVSDLLDELTEDYKHYNLPKTPNSLSRALKDISENLKSEGIEIEWGRYTADNTTRITLRIAPRAAAPPDSPVPVAASPTEVVNTGGIPAEVTPIEPAAEQQKAKVLAGPFV